MAGELGAALLVGIGAYQQAQKLATLRCAAHDAEGLADVLTDPALCGFPRDRVVLLTNENARREDIVHRLSKWLPATAQGSGLALVYFACHGAVQRVGQREEGFLLPFDADPDDLVTRGVAMSDVARWVEGIDAGAVIVCLDCCHAGKVVAHRAAHASPVERDMRIRPALLQGLSGRGRFLIASCDEGQTSVEAETWGHGLFTYHLLRGLRGEGDRDGDGRVGIAELFEYVAGAVEQDARACGAEQRPWYSAVGTGGVYLSRPGPRDEITIVGCHPSLEQLWRKQGAPAAVAEIERAIPAAGAEALLGMLDLLHRMHDPAGIPAVFGLLAHAAETVRLRARQVLQAFGWGQAAAAVEQLARQPGKDKIPAVLDGLAAFESHREVVALLDRLVSLLQGDLRNRTILLLERKRLGLELERMVDVFRQIHSPYTIRKALGQGLFTAAMLARDEENGLDVVVRVLRPEFASQPHFRARFLDLARQSVRFVHQNLILTREVRSFPDLNLHYAVRDHVDGVTLQRSLEAGRKFTSDEILAVLRQVCEALAPIHRAGAVHGGIKPSNIFLTQEDFLVLGDVSLTAQGLTASIDRLSYEYRYAPPEWFQGNARVGPWSDFYSLGCVAYELACGRPPFLSDHPFELAFMHGRENAAPPSQFGSRLGRAADGWILRLLARSPAERFQKSADALRSLDGLEQEPLTGSVDPSQRADHSRQSQPDRPRRPGASAWSDEALVSVVRFSTPGSSSAASSFSDQPDADAEQPSSPPQETASQGETARPGSLPDRVGRYTIMEQIGQGGMGVVYKAFDGHLGRQVALKLIRAQTDADSLERTRFQREAYLIAQLQHPNIVQIFDRGKHKTEEGVFIYNVQEFVEGGSLAGKLSGSSVSPMAAARMIVTLARAVHYAHSRGILHRDLKPSNILLTADGTPKIADFGLAKELDSDPTVTLTGGLVGTPAYMSPEQALGNPEKIGPATDLFSLGCIFYELLTGRRPYQAASVMETLSTLLHHDPVPPSQVEPNVPKVLDRICMNCLHKDPGKRYPSAEALAQDLDRFLERFLQEESGQPVSPGVARKGVLANLARWFARGT